MELRLPGEVRDDLGKVKISNANYMYALEVRCVLANNSSYTTNSLPYNKSVQQLIYKSDSKIDEELISNNSATKWNSADFASCKWVAVMR